VQSVLWLNAEGYNIFAFDYRGFGVSQGEPTIEGVVQDAQAALDYLLSGELTNLGDIIIYGQSLGGALAIITAANNPDKISALITDCAFSSWRKIYRQKAGEFIITWPFQYPISLFINDDYAPYKYISKIAASVKILLIHDKYDNVVPFEHATELYQAAEGKAELWLTNYSGHISSMKEPDFRKKILKYLNNY
jgi:fermentation-respiration switch protein FrsA (DUF1100 family)